SEQNEAVNHYQLVLIFLITSYLILSINFENLFYPLIILSIIPIGFIGIFCSFFIFRFSFSNGAFGSFIYIIFFISISTNMILSNCRKLEFGINNRYLLISLKQQFQPITIITLSSIFSLFPFLLT
ncbi:MAG: hypothetical protein Q8J87_03105, partial [Sediminibacterium sp.]|nr:hypothetical protein [Sediminibacterium sp.]